MMEPRLLTAPERNARKTHCKNGHPFTAENTSLVKNRTHGGTMRQCKTCKKERDKVRSRQRAAAKRKGTRPAMLAADWHARAEAYEECADHMTMAWTDDPKERAQAIVIERELRASGEKCRERAWRSAFKEGSNG